MVHTFFYLLPFDVFKCGIVDREVRAEGVTALVSDLEKCSLDTKILFRVLTVKQVPDGIYTLLLFRKRQRVCCTLLGFKSPTNRAVK